MGSYTPAEVYDQVIHTINIPEDVRRSGKATPEIIAEGVAFLHKDGIIVLDNAIDIDHVDALNAKLTPEALGIANDPEHHFNFGKQTRNMDQAPPPTKELMFKDIWCNPFAAAILAATLGPRPVIHYANGNTALKASPEGRQPVHSDCEFAHPAYFPFAHVININLVDTSAQNGGTEFWPGSHHVSVHEAHVSGSNDNEEQLPIRSELLEERRRHSPPIQASTKRGSMIIRDLRLWHAGMPNLSEEPRVMLAFVAQPAWFQAKSKILLPLSVKEMVESWSDELVFSAEYVDGEVDHKKLSSTGVDFDTKSPALLKFRDELSRWPDYVPRWY
jgi:ectoine hydroxylase-related dioxygenase (phytanoyl-CoA dioxygenase family)